MTYVKDNKVLGNCRLCHQLRPLQDSHILPECVFRPAYDITHTAIQIDIDQSKKFKQQKGFWERLLCKECEGIFNKWETYFCRIWFHPTQRLRPLLLENNIVTIPGIQYTIFKLFHLSIIWRAGICSRPEFKNVRLGTQEEKIRKRLLANDPGDPDDYTMFGIAIRETETKNFQDKLLRAPEASRYHGHYVYNILFGGVFWYYWISSHRGGRIPINCIGRDGILTLAVQDWNENWSIQDLAKSIQKNLIR